MIFVYVWQEKEGDRDQISRILKATLEEEFFVITSLKDNEVVEHVEEDMILCFGARVHNLTKTKYPNAIALPELPKLVDSPSNRESRLKAWEILKQLKEKPVEKEQDTELLLEPEDLAVALQGKLDQLKKNMAADGTTHWVGTTKMGKKVVISTSPKTDIPCDYSITVEELYAAKLAVEILGLKTLTLVKGK